MYIFSAFGLTVLSYCPSSFEIVLFSMFKRTIQIMRFQIKTTLHQPKLLKENCSSKGEG